MVASFAVTLLLMLASICAGNVDAEDFPDIIAESSGHCFSLALAKACGGMSMLSKMTLSDDDVSDGVEALDDIIDVANKAKCKVKSIESGGNASGTKRKRTGSID